MRIFNCLIYEHNPWIIVLAGLMCVIGSLVATMMIRRTFEGDSHSRLHWCFLSAVTAGAATWATHFIAMLGYESKVPVSFDAPLTVVSALIAVVGIGAGLGLAMLRSRVLSNVLGGGLIGLSIAAMHYVGMFAYRADGIIRWQPDYILASVLIAVLLSGFFIDRVRCAQASSELPWQAVLLALAIVCLHFTGMAAFSVLPIDGVSSGADSAAFAGMASIIALVGLLIAGTGISTFLVERQTQTRSQDEMAHIAMHDTLTGLANRHRFSEALEQECTRLERYSVPFALLSIDLDRFKPVNDTLGHPIGDLVLKKVAERVRRAVRTADLVARIGGDEFAVVAIGVSDPKQATEIAERIVKILSRPFVVNGNVAELGASVGIALAPEHGATGDELVRHADVALYSAKRAGRDRHCIFELPMMDEIRRRRFLEADLRRACMREDFKVVYQPVIDPVSGQITAGEALLRWSSPDHGDVSPSEFIPVAEELGLVSRIGAGVLRQACQDAATWPVHLDVAVNVSPVQLVDPRLSQTVAQALTETGLDPSRLELEITETALLNNDEAALKTLNLLCEMGVRISLDDFGTGYSSLSYLHRFPISRIKIDKSFVQRLPDDAGSASIVRAITQLGESLSMKITAEGIETSEQLEFIKAYGCDHVQGFLMGRPVKTSEFLDLLREQPSVRAA